MSKPKATHTSFPRGARIHVILRDGSSFTDRFLQSKSGRMQFFDHGWVPVSDIRVTNFAKGRTN